MKYWILKVEAIIGFFNTRVPDQVCIWEGYSSRLEEQGFQVGRQQKLGDS
jgi:hypothetical protein